MECNKSSYINSSKNFCLFHKKNLFFSILHNYFYKTPVLHYLLYTLLYLNNHFLSFFNYFHLVFLSPFFFFFFFFAASSSPSLLLLLRYSSSAFCILLVMSRVRLAVEPLAPQVMSQNARL